MHPVYIVVERMAQKIKNHWVPGIIIHYQNLERCKEFLAACRKQQASSGKPQATSGKQQALTNKNKGLYRRYESKRIR